MPRFGFFELDDWFIRRDGIRDPLVRIGAPVDREGITLILGQGQAKPRKRNTGRKAFDGMLMFKTPVLRHMYNNCGHSPIGQSGSRVAANRRCD